MKPPNELRPRLRTPRASLVIAAVGFLLAGCMTSTSASLRGGSDASELKVVRTTSGLIWGPCMPAPGSVSCAYVVTLQGERTIYSVGEFRIFRELPSGARFPLKVDRGVIEVDRKKRTLHVDVTVGGKPCEVNGRFSLDANPA